MQTKSKSNSVITHEVHGDSSVTFRVAGAGSAELTFSAVSPQNRERAMLHGFIQRISDAAAISRDPQTGKPASPADKLAAMKSLIDHYHSGTTEWGRKREGGMGDGGMLVRALCQLHPQSDPSAIREKVKSWSAAERRAVEATPKVKALLDQWRSEAGRGVDVENLLEQLV